MWLRGRLLQTRNHRSSTAQEHHVQHTASGYAATAAAPPNSLVQCTLNHVCHSKLCVTPSDICSMGVLMLCSTAKTLQHHIVVTAINNG
jgi:hypothetical protein